MKHCLSSDESPVNFFMRQKLMRETCRERNDTHALVDSLLKKLNRPKLYLAGFCGTSLGFHVADKHPGLFQDHIINDILPATVIP